MVSATFVTLVGLLSAAVLNPRSELYRVYASPSGAYRLVVYRYVQRIAVMPGDSSGAPGYVRLYDSGGRKCGEAKLAIVAAASSPSDVKWDEGDVSIPGAFGLRLPRNRGLNLAGSRMMLRWYHPF